jgi:hypothetical protein
MTRPILANLNVPQQFIAVFTKSRQNTTHSTHIVDRSSSVGIATRYGLDGPGIESRWGPDFPHPSRTALGPTQPPIQWVPGLSWG